MNSVPPTTHAGLYTFSPSMYRELSSSDFAIMLKENGGDVTKRLHGATLFHIAAASGNLDQIPKDYLDKIGERLCMSGLGATEIMSVVGVGGAGGQTPLHVAAHTGHLNQVSYAALDKYLAEKDDNGWTPLHWAARSGHLAQVPDSLIVKFWNVVNNSGENLMHTAAFHGHLPQVPHVLLSEDKFILATNLGNTVLHMAAIGRNLDKFPWNIVGYKVLDTNKKLYPEPFNQSSSVPSGGGDFLSCGSVLHAVASSGFWGGIPESELTEQRICGGIPEVDANVLHYAANAGKLAAVPRCALYISALTAPNSKGYTPVHAAVRLGETDVLLGLDMPESTKHILGDEWFRRNREILAEIKKGIEWSPIVMTEDTADIDI